ncbi:unnamed protein product, partial [Ectocarpus fasciculatus]
RVIELGGGTGALSVGLARSGAASVTCTDLPCHLARIRSTVLANAPTNTSRRRGVPGSDVVVGGGDGSRGGGDCGGVVAGTVCHGSDLPAATEVPEVAAREASVRVAALRWGEEEDIANARASPFNNQSGEGAINTAPQDRRCNSSGGGGESDDESSAAFDVIVLSEVLYWPALDLLQEDTREPLRRTLVGLSKPGTKVILIYKERWPEREAEFLRSCEASFEVRGVPADL